MRPSRRPRTSPPAARRSSTRRRGRITSRTRCTITGALASLRRYPSAPPPSSRTRWSRSSFQERRMTGTSRRTRSRLRARQSAKPSRTGMTTSVITRSGVTRWAISRARAPSCASWTTAPVARSTPARNHVTAGSSSATTTILRSRLTAPGPTRASPSMAARPSPSPSHGAMGSAPSGPPAVKRTFPADRMVTTSRMRATAPQRAASTSLPSPRSKRVSRPWARAASPSPRRSSSTRRAPSSSTDSSPKAAPRVGPASMPAPALASAQAQWSAPGETGLISARAAPSVTKGAASSGRVHCPTTTTGMASVSGSAKSATQRSRAPGRSASTTTTSGASARARSMARTLSCVRSTS